MIKKLILLLLALLCLSSCSKTPNESKLTCKLSYFERDNISEVISTKKTLESTSCENAINEVFNLLAHPKDNSYISAIPQGIHLLDSSFENGKCTLTLSPAYNNLSPDERVTLNFVLTQTMLSLPDAKELSVTCNGSTVHFSSESFTSDTPKTYHNTYLANLYFVNSDYTNAIPIQKSIQLSDEISLERSVAELLIGESGLDGVVSPFPKGTTLNDIYLDGGSCIIDVSSKFITSANHGKEQETTILLSIVNTMTELPKIDSVKFLIDGSDGYGYVHYDLSSPMTNSEELFED